MSKSTISTFELFQMFPDAESARVYMEGKRWPDGAVCPARSAWDMAQGITAVARRIPNTDDRLDMEIVAGRILTKVAA